MTRIDGVLAAIVLGGSIAALAVPESISQPLISGEARVTDGDSLEILASTDYGKPTRIRIAGIDAPELGQMCGPIHCGLAAKVAMQEAIGRDIVTCKPSGLDRYGRTLAECATARVRDLGQRMVATGMALAYRRYSARYIDAEEAAKADNLGFWRTGNFGNPEDWRHGRR